VADLPIQLAEPLAPRLRAVADVEGKLVRALETLGPLAGRDVAYLDLPEGPLRERLEAAGAGGRYLSCSDPLVIDADDGSVDTLVSLWSGFRGVHDAELREADRVLRPDGRLLVVHDYGRDDVSELRGTDAPEYGAWSRRDGPFLGEGGFKIRVLHCFWTFDTLDETREFLSEAFGPSGESVGSRLKRPRLSWNVAIYHRSRRAQAPETPPPDEAARVAATSGNRS
jgi:SAM-dependent methyltransferase